MIVYASYRLDSERQRTNEIAMTANARYAYIMVKINFLIALPEIDQ